MTSSGDIERAPRKEIIWWELPRLHPAAWWTRSFLVSHERSAPLWQCFRKRRRRGREKRTEQLENSTFYNMQHAKFLLICKTKRNKIFTDGIAKFRLICKKKKKIYSLMALQSFDLFAKRKNKNKTIYSLMALLSFNKFAKRWHSELLEYCWGKQYCTVTENNHDWSKINSPDLLLWDRSLGSIAWCSSMYWDVTGLFLLS